jgi:mannose-6-phosphate isomerase-like protein (cupin superfamily)
MIRVVSLFVALLLLFGAAASPGAPTWLQAHTHQGAECILTLRGITSWWFETAGSPRVPSPVIVPVHKGESLYTAKGRVHTAGNTGPETMAYLGIHLLEAGAPFRTDVQSASAPPIQSTKLKSYFKTLFPNQPRREGAFMTANRIEQLGPGGGYERPRSTGDAYYTVVHGSATIVIGAASTTLTQYQSLVIPRHTAARINTARPAPTTPCSPSPSCSRRSRRGRDHAKL